MAEVTTFMTKEESKEDLLISIAILRPDLKVSHLKKSTLLKIRDGLRKKAASKQNHTTRTKDELYNKVVKLKKERKQYAKEQNELRKILAERDREITEKEITILQEKKKTFEAKKKTEEAKNNATEAKFRIFEYRCREIQRNIYVSEGLSQLRNIIDVIMELGEKGHINSNATNVLCKETMKTFNILKKCDDEELEEKEDDNEIIGDDELEEKEDDIEISDDEEDDEM